MVTTFEATTMAVYLSLNVEVIDDQRGTGFLAIPLLSLAWLLVIGWWYQTFTTRLQSRLDDWLATWRLRLVLVSISWRALAWGLTG
ncbi:MAG: hypothetical protein KDI79_20875 [Anaerolineae bacterium]|nr:hypothetical protein [Anaerolineae bacterium]